MDLTVGPPLVDNKISPQMNADKHG